MDNYKVVEFKII